MSINVPEFMPVLSAGAHKSPAEGACIMEYASFINGEEWTDRPSCTNEHLARAARFINDTLEKDDRQKLLPLLPRLMGTAEPGADQAVFDAAAEYVMPLTSHHMPLVVMDARETINCAARGQFHGIGSAVFAVHEAGGDLIDLLSTLIDAYDAAVGRTEPATVTADDLRRCAELTGASA